MRRRPLLVGVVGATSIASSRAWGQAARGVPVVGFLRSTPAGPFAHIVEAFREGLAEAGFHEGRDVVVAYRWADNRLGRLPGLVNELVEIGAAVIVGNILAVEVAKAAAPWVPIVFVGGDNPVQAGLVDSLARPGGNLTGVTFVGGAQLDAKRLQLLAELVPHADPVAALLDPAFSSDTSDLEGAARKLGKRLLILRATRARELEAAFADMAAAGAGALLVSGSPVFTSLRLELVALAARYRIPAIYDQRDHAVAGGLVSYGSSFTHAYRQAGIYAGHILKGKRPADLPVQQPTRLELVVNLATARALGLTVPPAILLRADELIE